MLLLSRWIGRLPFQWKCLIVVSRDARRKFLSRSHVFGDYVMALCIETFRWSVAIFVLPSSLRSGGASRQRSDKR